MPGNTSNQKHFCLGGKYFCLIVKVGHIDINCSLPKCGFNSEEVMPLICIKEKVTYLVLSEYGYFY